MQKTLSDSQYTRSYVSLIAQNGVVLYSLGSKTELHKLLQLQKTDQDRFKASFLQRVFWRNSKPYSNTMFLTFSIFLPVTFWFQNS